MREDDLVHRLELAALDHRGADVARDVLSVGHHEELVALEHLDTEGVQIGFGEPGHLGAGVVPFGLRETGHREPELALYEKRGGTGCWI